MSTALGDHIARMTFRAPATTLPETVGSIVAFKNPEWIPRSSEPEYFVATKLPMGLRSGLFYSPSWRFARTVTDHGEKISTEDLLNAGAYPLHAADDTLPVSEDTLVELNWGEVVLFDNQATLQPVRDVAVYTPRSLTNFVVDGVEIFELGNAAWANSAGSWWPASIFSANPTVVIRGSQTL